MSAFISKPTNKISTQCGSVTLNYVDHKTLSPKLPKNTIVGPISNSSNRTGSINLNIANIRRKQSTLSSLNDDTDTLTDFDKQKFNTSKQVKDDDDDDDDDDDHDDDDDDDDDDGKFKVKLKMPSKNKKLRDEWSERLKQYLSKFKDMMLKDYVTNVEYINLIGEYKSKCSSYICIQDLMRRHNE